MSNIVTTNSNINVVQVTSPGPLGPRGAAGPVGPPGTITGNSGVNSTGSSIFSGSVTIIGTLTVTGSNTFINIGPALFTGSVDISGSLSAISASAQYFTGSFVGSGAGLTSIPASSITGLSLFRIASGSISASVQPGSNSFILNNGGTNLFTVNNSGLGTFANGLTVNGSTGTFNQGLSVSNGATLGGGVTLNGGTTVNTSLSISGTATINGNTILTTANVSTNRITDSNISASVSSTGKAFNVTNNATSLMSVDQNGAISGSGLNITSSTYNTLISTPNITLVGNATLNGQPITTAGDLTLNQIKSGAVTASVSTGQNSFTVQNGASTLMNVSSSGYVSASGFIGDGSQLSNVGITYLSGSNPLINSIEVADFDNNVAVTYVGGNLKFIFGTPLVPSAPAISFNSTFDTNRFNLQTDNYTATATWAVGGYSLVRASMVDLSTGTEVASTTSGTSLPFNTTTTGSQSYRIAVTASSPLDGSTNIQTATVTGTLSKGAPSNPVITPTATVQLGSTSNQIESGATGSISFTAAYGASDNGWEKVSLVSSSNSPITVTAGNTPSATLTANYQSPAGTNSPTATTSTGDSFSYSRITSLRFGASSTSSFSPTQLQDLALWDTTLGGSIGTIRKGTTNPSGQTITINTVDTVGGSYLYIIYSGSPLSTIVQNLQNVTNNFTTYVTGSSPEYRVYRSNGLVYGTTTLSLT